MSGHRYQTTEQRFWNNVQRSEGCWEWQGHTDKDGYGRLRVDGRATPASRYSYTLHYGAISGGLLVCHRCDNPRCVRPDHLFLGTSRDNNADRAAKGRSATGDTNGARKYPERRPRGETHYNYQNQQASQKGTGNGRAKLTEEDVRMVRSLWNCGTLTKRAIARSFGVTDALIGKIIRRELWTHID